MALVLQGLCDTPGVTPPFGVLAEGRPALALVDLGFFGSPRADAILEILCVRLPFEVPGPAFTGTVLESAPPALTPSVELGLEPFAVWSLPLEVPHVIDRHGYAACR